MKKNIYITYIYIYVCINTSESLYARNKHNIVNQLYFSKNFYFIYLFLTVGFHCFGRAFSSCSAWTSRCNRFSCWGALEREGFGR